MFSNRPRFSLAVAAVGLSALSACSLTPNSTGGGAASPTSGSGGGEQKAAVSAAKVVSNIRSGAPSVDLGRTLRLSVASGTFEKVAVTAAGAPVQGRFVAGKTRWRSTVPLKPGTAYTVVSTAVDADGVTKDYRSTFTTRKLSLDEQTFPSIVPLGHQTVGVGMPVIVRFDVPVTDRASIERHLKVTSRPAQPGAFHWVSSQEVHWRPKNFWKPGTDVTINADIGGVPAGNGIYGQKNRSGGFHVGDSMVSKVDMVSDQMRVFRNGRLIRTIPITTGRQPDFTTRSGTKVIVEKFRHKRMNSETIGIDPNSADGYDLSNVEYAMRVTYSGEFIHAAPWSVGQQGHSNVSHGCTGMSTANAGWLYNQSKMGDVVQYTGTSRTTDLTNGFGDWNLPFAAYKAGSALS